MKSFLQVLRLVFWVNPLQRVLICLGVFFVVIDISGEFVTERMWAAIPPSLGRLIYAVMAPIVLSPGYLSGLTYASIACLTMGGVYWRIASAPRIVRLAPHGRARLLGCAAGLLLLIATLWALDYWLYIFLSVEPKYHPPLREFLISVAGCAVAVSVIAIGLFIASRSPVAALAVLILVASPGLALALFDLDLQRLVRPGPLASVLLALIWIPFAIWYLKARRISRPSWLASGGQDVLATAKVSVTRPRSRREAIERLLLGGTTAVQISLLWFVVLGLLLGMQWLFFRAGEPPAPEVQARVMYASLCICPIVTTLVSFAAIRRSRAPWLLATSSRVEFFACIDGILMRLNYLMALVHAFWLVVLWFAFSWQPGPFLEQLDAKQLNWMLLWVPGFFATNAQLARLWKWPVAAFAAGTLVILWRLSGTGVRGHLLSVTLLIAAIVATFVLRVLARRRWRDGDFPRGVPAAAS